MSFSSKKTSHEVLEEQRKNHNDERYASVEVKELVYVTSTPKAILVKEGEEGVLHKVWLPRSMIRSSTPALNALEPGDELELEIPKWLADENELFYL